MAVWRCVGGLTECGAGVVIVAAATSTARLLPRLLFLLLFRLLVFPALRQPLAQLVCEPQDRSGTRRINSRQGCSSRAAPRRANFNRRVGSGSVRQVAAAGAAATPSVCISAWRGTAATGSPALPPQAGEGGRLNLLQHRLGSGRGGVGKNG
jgi:hypothetical protein